MGTADAFDGFHDGTLSFLHDLGAQNDKVWFDANRDRYKTEWLDPAVAFVAALSELLLALDPNLHAEPRVNGSIFRINRDVRFSKDKTPYKDRLDLWFWGRGGRKAGPGCYFRLTTEGVIVGAGMHGFDKNHLTRYRDAAAGPDAGVLAKLVATTESKGYHVGGVGLKTVPRGYPADHPHADLLRHKALFADVETDHPDCLGRADFLDWCIEHWRGVHPLVQWLEDNVNG
ncbi:MAG: hypothetical protein ACI9WU_001348 [Myxococcota bacterium]|jgi:uncharacterized protein (TIGR02453 family)